MNFIRSEAIALDTNVYVFGIRADVDHTACQHLIESVADMLLYVPQQVVTEVHRNLRHVELRAFYSVLESAAGVAWGLGPAPDELVRRYEALGAKKGDAAIAAQLAAAGVRWLVSENRHFLGEIGDLPFSVLSAEDALRLLAESGKSLLQ